MARAARTAIRTVVPPTLAVNRVPYSSGVGLSGGGLHSAFVAEAANGTPYFIGCSNGVLFRSTNGVAWGKTGPAYTDVGYWGKTDQLILNGLYVSKNGWCFVIPESTGTLRVTRTPHDYTENQTLDFVRTEDNAANFSATFDADHHMGGRQWTWEEVEFDWQATGGLVVGDIILKFYHTATATFYRRAYIYVLRYDGTQSAGQRWQINSATTGGSAKPVANIIGDPFSWWNTYRANRYRHIHDGRLCQDGYFYFATGDFLTTETITSIDNTNGTDVVLTKNGHELIEGTPITIAGVTGPTSLNDNWYVKYVNANTFKLYSIAGVVKQGTGTAVTAAGTFKVTNTPGQTTSQYQFHRIKPGDTTGATYETLTNTSNHGYTAIIRRPDGSLLCGTDFGESAATEGLSFIDRWVGNVKTRVWTAETAAMNWPIFALAQHEDGKRIWAFLRRPGSTSAVGVARGQILYSADGGVSFKRILLSGYTPRDINWIDVDTPAMGRNGMIYTECTKLMWIPKYEDNDTFQLRQHYTIDI